MRIFLAGATGVIGRRLGPLLVADGHAVIGTTRHAARADDLRALGVESVLIDVFDAPAVRAAIVNARPDVLIHQLTDLAPLDDRAVAQDPVRLATARAANARIRDEGTRNLLVGARDAGVTRIVAQSIAFAYAPGATPHRESDPLAIDAPGSAGLTARGVASLERQVGEGPWQAIVLRYGRLYGPGIGAEAFPPALHVDDAARIAALAVHSPASGVFNIAEDGGFADVSRARSAFAFPGYPTDDRRMAASV